MEWLAFFVFCSTITTHVAAEQRVASKCDPEGTVREFNIFEKVIHGSSHKKCICQEGYYGRYCERIHSCMSGRPFAMNCTDPPQAFETATRIRCAIGPDREIDVCLCFTGYRGNRCEQTIQNGQGPNIHVQYLRHGPVRPPKSSESEEQAGRLAIVSRQYSSQEEEEAMAIMETRFWYLAFCIAISAVLVILLIGLYFLIMQTIYKSGLRHLTESELRRRMQPGYVKERQDSLSLPPPYEEDVERRLFEEVPEQSRRSTALSVSEVREEEAPPVEVPQYRPLFVHV